jgi:hypothetical protein
MNTHRETIRNPKEKYSIWNKIIGLDYELLIGVAKMCFQ